MTEERNHTDNWSIRSAIPFGCSHKEFPSSSCAASLTTQLAATDLEELSEAEQVELAEHLKTCLACSAVVAEYQRIKEAFIGCPIKEPHMDEPESQLSPQLIQMWEEDGVDIVKKLGERRQQKMIKEKGGEGRMYCHSLMRARQAHGWTQEEVAQALNIEEVWFWSNWEVDQKVFMIVTWLRIIETKLWMLTLSIIFLLHQFQKIMAIRKLPEEQKR